MSYAKFRQTARFFADRRANSNLDFLVLHKSAMGTLAEPRSQFHLAESTPNALRTDFRGRPMKTRRLTSLTQDRRGTALVEMALVLPIFVAVTLGIVEFGRAMMVGQLVTNAAREGARLAIIDGSTNQDVEDYIEDFLAESAGIQSADLTVTITVAPAEGNPNPNNQVAAALPRDLVTVFISVPFNKVSYVAGNYLNGKTLSGRSAMRHE